MKRNSPTLDAAGFLMSRNLWRTLDIALPATVLLALAAALVTLLTGCGGTDDTPAPAAPTNGALTAQQIGDAQSVIDTSTTSVDAGSTALSAAQIDNRRAALDGATTDGIATISANQAALDEATGLVPTF